MNFLFTFTQLIRLSLIGLTKLKSIKINDNQIKSLPEELFQGLTDLEVLQLQNNAIGHLPLKIFQDLRNLTQLVLTGNSLINILPGLFSKYSILKNHSFLPLSLCWRS